MTFSFVEYMVNGKKASFDVEMLEGIVKAVNMEALNIDPFPNLISGLQGKYFGITNIFLVDHIR